MLVKYVGIINSIVKQLEEETQPKTPRFPFAIVEIKKCAYLQQIRSERDIRVCLSTITSLCVLCTCLYIRCGAVHIHMRCTFVPLHHFRNVDELAPLPPQLAWTSLPCVTLCPHSLCCCRLQKGVCVKCNTGLHAPQMIIFYLVVCKHSSQYRDQRRGITLCAGFGASQHM